MSKAAILGLLMLNPFAYRYWKRWSSRNGIGCPVLHPAGWILWKVTAPGWEGSLLTGSLRFRHLSRCRVEGNKIVEEEIMLKNIGRVRNVMMGPDGYIYVAVENPGHIFRLIPVTGE